MTAAIARPMPVLPDVPSMIVPPGFSKPAFSASSIILTAMRSLIELPGLKVSSLARTVASMTPAGDRVDADERRVADGVEDGVAELAAGMVPHAIIIAGGRGEGEGGRETGGRGKGKGG